MATNRKMDSGTISFPATGAITSGTPFVTAEAGEEIVLVPKIDGASGDSVPCWTRGIFNVTKATDANWVVGEKVYYDTSDSDFTAVGTANVYAGRAASAAATTATTADIDLNASGFGT